LGAAVDTRDLNVALAVPDLPEIDGPGNLQLIIEQAIVLFFFGGGSPHPDLILAVFDLDLRLGVALAEEIELRRPGKRCVFLDDNLHIFFIPAFDADISIGIFQENGTSCLQGQTPIKLTEGDMQAFRMAGIHHCENTRHGEAKGYQNDENGEFLHSFSPISD
jgi:hypothetical protein